MSKGAQKSRITKDTSFKPKTGKRPAKHLSRKQKARLRHVHNDKYAGVSSNSKPKDRPV